MYLGYYIYLTAANMELPGIIQQDNSKIYYYQPKLTFSKSWNK